MKIRVLDETRALEVGGQAFYVLRQVFAFSGVRLEVNEAGMRRVHDSIAGLPRFHAQNDVTERQTEALVVSTQLQEHVLPHHLTCAGDCQVVPVALSRAEYAGGLLRSPRENVT